MQTASFIANLNKAPYVVNLDPGGKGRIRCYLYRIARLADGDKEEDYTYDPELFGGKITFKLVDPDMEAKLGATTILDEFFALLAKHFPGKARLPLPKALAEFRDANFVRASLRFPPRSHAPSITSPSRGRIRRRWKMRRGGPAAAAATTLSMRRCLRRWMRSLRKGQIRMS